METGDKKINETIEKCRKTLIDLGYWSTTTNIKTLRDYRVVEWTTYFPDKPMTSHLDAPPLWIVGTLLPIDFQRLVDRCIVERRELEGLKGSLHSFVACALSSALQKWRVLAGFAKRRLEDLEIFPIGLPAHIVEYFAGPVEVLHTMWVDIGPDIVYTFDYNVAQTALGSTDIALFQNIQLLSHDEYHALSMYCQLIMSTVKFPVPLEMWFGFTTKSFAEMSISERKAALAYILQITSANTESNLDVASDVCEWFTNCIEDGRIANSDPFVSPSSIVSKIIP